MYLHLGAGAVVRTDSIIGVVGRENASQSHLTRSYLTAAEKRGQVVNVAEDIPKSFVVCRDGGKTIVYLSQMSPQTLQRRIEAVLIR